MFTKIMKRKNKSAAQAMAEFALVLPILLLIVYGLLEVGRLLFIWASVNTASRQAVRYGSAIGLVDTNDDGTLDTKRYRDCNGIIAAANNTAFITRFTNVNITYDRGIDSNGIPIPITNPLTINPDPETASANTCTLVRSLAQDPIQNGDRISVYVSAEFSPVIPFVPLGPFTIDNGNPIRSSASRTIVGEISIEVTAVPAAWGGAGGGANSLDLSITPSPETYSTLGEIITYTYTLANSGQNSLTAPYSISDNKVGNISCAGATSPLAPGASTTCTGTYTITQADLDYGSMTNTATATAGATTSPSANATIIATQNPQLNLQITPSPIVAFNLGQVVTYTFSLANTGNVTLNGPFSVTDDTLPAVNCAGATSPLAPGATTSCTGSYTITNADINAGFVTNYAIASCSQAISNLASATVITKPLVLSVSASPDTANAIGQVITYTYTLRNAGISNLTSPYSITDDKVTTIDCSGATSPLAPGSTTTCTGTYSIVQADADAGFVINRATATARLSGQQVTSNQASTSVLVTGIPRISLSIGATPNPATTLGTVINYTYTVTNTGTLSLTAPFTVADNKFSGLVNCSGATSPLEPGASTTCTHAHTVTQEDLDNGSIVNTATVTANVGANLVTSNPVFATVITYTNPRLTLEKYPNPETATAIGQTITYTYRLRNTGNVTLSSPYTVNDNKISGTNTCPGAASTIPVGGFVNCTATYNITAADVGAGSVTNQAIATARVGTQTITSNLEFATVTVNTALACDPRHSVLKVNPFGYTIYNYGSSTISIAQIQVFFNNANGNGLQGISYGGITIWTGNENGSPAALTTFSGDVSLTPGASKLLEMSFKKAYETNGTERILVTFAQGGCPVLDSSNSGQLP